MAIEASKPIEWWTAKRRVALGVFLMEEPRSPKRSGRVEQELPLRSGKRLGITVGHSRGGVMCELRRHAYGLDSGKSVLCGLFRHSWRIGMQKMRLGRRTVIFRACLVLLIALAMNSVWDTRNSDSFSLFEPGDVLGPSIVGTWEETDYIFFQGKITFFPDGKISAGVGGIQIAGDGNYTIKNGLLTVTDRDGVQHVSKVFINNEKLTIRGENGQVVTLRLAK